MAGVTSEPLTALAFAARCNLNVEGNELDALLQLHAQPTPTRVGINSVAYTAVAAICLWRLFALGRSHVVIPVPDAREGISCICALRTIASHATEDIRLRLLFRPDWGVIHRDNTAGPSCIEWVPYGWLDHRARKLEAPLTIAFWDFERAPGIAVHDALRLGWRSDDLIVLNHPHGV